MRFAGPAIPVSSVRVIAFDPMKMGVHPITHLITLRLGELVRFIPVPFCFMPKCLENGRKFVRDSVLIQ